MKKTKIIFMFSSILLFMMTACTSSPDTCGKGMVMDKRFNTLPSPTAGLCIKEKDCSGQIKDGECVANDKIDAKCDIIADCTTALPQCTSDPMVIHGIASKAGAPDALIEKLFNGFNISHTCTILGCDPTDKDACPKDYKCLAIAGTKGALTMCTKQDKIGAEGMGDACNSQDDCDLQGKEAKFCTYDLAQFSKFTGVKDEICLVSCDPATNTKTGSKDCEKEGLYGFFCADITSAAQLGVDLNGTKGICVPPSTTSSSSTPETNFGMECKQESDCKSDKDKWHDATFCTNELALFSKFTHVTQSVCAFSCDPKDNDPVTKINPTCKKVGLIKDTCTDITSASKIGAEIGKTKGLCVPVTSKTTTPTTNFGMECSDHPDCKSDKDKWHDATFCTAGLASHSDMTGVKDSVCAFRCDPSKNDSQKNTNPDCVKAGLIRFTCTDISQASMLGIDLDGAKGLCTPPKSE